MYSDRRKQEERYPYFLAIQITAVELPCEFSYLFGGLALTVLNILLRNTCTHFLFHSDYYFFKMVHTSIARDLGKEIWR